MELGSTQILADADIGKLVVGILVFVFWGIGSLASMVKKANEEAKRRAIARAKAPGSSGVARAPGDQRMVVGAFATGAGLRPSPPSTSVPRRAPVVIQRKQPIRPPAELVQAPVATRAPASKPQPAAATSRPVLEKVVSSAATNIARVKLAGASAPAIRRWMVADTMRKQFILTEILRPPIALREQREG